jgi:glycerate 2-kinase
MSSRGADICKVLAAGINNADAGDAIKKNVTRDDKYLHIEKGTYELQIYKRVFIISIGKAAIPMAIAVNEILGEKVTAGSVITTDGYPVPESISTDAKVKIFRASHPIPDMRNLDAGGELFSLIKDIGVEDLVIFLLSGGGSALLMKPHPGISLQDIQGTTSLLLKCGAPITEINTIRKHLDVFKGGGLANLLNPATVVTLILSDVVGDNLDVIASGPTVADPTTFQDAWTVLKKYKILDQIPPSISAHISDGMIGKIPETIKPGDPILKNVTNIIVGNNNNAVLSAMAEAESLGFNTRILTTSLQGEASLIGKSIIEQAKNLISLPSKLPKPACLIAGGETTVTIKGNGLGGRNQELALGAVIGLSGSEEMILISLATDGVDGPTDAAGAVTTNETYSRGLEMGLNPQEYLNMNDAYHYYKILDDLLKTGPTLTNVNDLVAIFAL